MMFFPFNQDAHFFLLKGQNKPVLTDGRRGCIIIAERQSITTLACLFTEISPFAALFWKGAAL
jgi:hypothetical protein